MCSLPREVFLELLPSLDTTDFIQSLKRFNARRGYPSKVYSDHGKIFVATAKWLKKVRREERSHFFLSERSIQWQFNLSRVPCRGGQFERLIGWMKSMFYKTVGQGLLTWKELSEVIRDIEVAMNNRPLSVTLNKLQGFYSILRYSMFRGRRRATSDATECFPDAKLQCSAELQPYHIEERDLRKRGKFLMKTKDVMWRRWTTDYLSSLP